MSYNQKISDRVNYIKNILSHLPDAGQWEIAESESDGCVYIRCTSECEKQKERVFGYYKKTTLSGFIKPAVKPLPSGKVYKANILNKTFVFCNKTIG